MKAIHLHFIELSLEKIIHEIEIAGSVVITGYREVRDAWVATSGMSTEKP
jgi:hypothetical protein